MICYEHKPGDAYMYAARAEPCPAEGAWDYRGVTDEADDEELAIVCDCGGAECMRRIPFTSGNHRFRKCPGRILELRIDRKMQEERAK
jgi:hypothetical protein